MRAIIFAAGRSRRLGELTNTTPKCCLSLIEGDSFISRQFRGFSKNGIDDLIVITGHADEKIKNLIDSDWVKSFKSNELIHNPEFESMNNVYTAFLARDYFNSNSLIFNSDIIYDFRILEKAVKSVEENPERSFIVVDDQKKLVDEDMKIKVDEKGNVIKISKEQINEECVGEYIGIMHLSEKDIKFFNESLSQMIKDGETDEYYEDALDKVLDKIELKVLSTDGLLWAEVDTPEDLERARGLECVKSQFQTV